MELINRKATYLPEGGGRTLWTPWGLVTYKITTGQTSGAYSLFEWNIRSQGTVPPHIEHREDECLYVLESEFEFLKDEETLRAGAGAVIYVPRGTVHAFENVDVGPGRILSLFTPGGAHERFFEEVGEEARNSESPRTTPPDFRKLASTAARYGIEMLPPTR